MRLFVFAIVLFSGVSSLADTDQRVAEKQLLKKIYEMRMRYDSERTRAENEARANVRLVGQSGVIDNPTVSGLRAQTSTQLSKFEQKFRCLDVDVNSQGGNTVVICGDNTGNISGSNTNVGGDVITHNGGVR